MIEALWIIVGAPGLVYIGLILAVKLLSSRRADISAYPRLQNQTHIPPSFNESTQAPRHRRQTEQREND